MKDFDLNIFDNTFTKEEVQDLFNHFITYPFTFGEINKYGYPPTGMISELSSDNEKIKFCLEKISNKINRVKNKPISRIYLNLFTPREIPYFNNDGEFLIAIVYLNDVLMANEGGEIQFLDDARFIGSTVFPVPGRICLFDGKIHYKDTSFRNYHRLTLTVKYINDDL
tara:strand:- start:389 stop:892 length:504 start_codon:yes stop_codon:yes gene_type:complete